MSGCPPCKVVINEEAQNAAARLTRITELTLDMAAGKFPELSAEQDDALYDAAVAEVALVKASKEAAVAMAKRCAAPPRWLALVEQL